MPLIEDRSSSMAVATSCTTAPTAAVPAIGGTGRSGRRVPECLDWVLVRNRRHLQRVLTAYVAHCNTARPHRGVNLDVPLPPPEATPAGIPNVRPIQRVDVLGGLIHEYRRAA
jgi:hypothetical protein